MNRRFVNLIRMFRFTKLTNNFSFQLLLVNLNKSIKISLDCNKDSKVCHDLLKCKLESIENDTYQHIGRLQEIEINKKASRYNSVSCIKFIFIKIFLTARKVLLH